MKIKVLIALIISIIKYICTFITKYVEIYKINCYYYIVLTIFRYSTFYIYIEFLKLYLGGFYNEKDEAKPVTFTLTKESNVWLPGENDVVALMNVIVGM